MTREDEREIDSLYEFLGIEEKKEENVRIGSGILKEERTVDLFAKRWDSSFFANTIRY